MTPVKVRFGEFTVDSDARQLRQAGRDVHLSPKAFDLLVLLVAHRPNVLDKKDLHTRIWRDTYVGDANLNVLVGEIRKALDDAARQPRFIRTVHGVGYAFCGEATDAAEARAESRGALCWLTWKGTTFPLADGGNEIGRDPRCAVWLDVPGVSRRHARVHLDFARRVGTLEDLGSTNGTSVGRSPVTAPVPVHNDDVIKVGPVDLRLRLWVADAGGKTRRIRRPRRE
jgi:DNA-binding winged helix-turn-helix (wHTH) protein